MSFTLRNPHQGRGILWDNDGVLVDTEKVFFEANRAELAALGVVATWADFEAMSLHRGVSMLSLAGIEGDDLRSLYYRRDARYRDLLSTAEILIPGMGDLLEILARRFRMGIVTSSHRDHFEIIHARTGFLRHFAFHVVREDYALSKPNPDGYLTAIDLIGLPASCCLAVEDSPRGLAAARSAGLEVIYFAPGYAGSQREIGDVFARADNVDELQGAIDDWVSS